MINSDASKRKGEEVIIITMTDKIKTYLINDDCFKVLKIKMKQLIWYLQTHHTFYLMMEYLVRVERLFR